MGRPKKQDTVNLGMARVRKDVGERIFKLIEDPAKPGRVQYGALKTLLEKLFAQHLKEMDAISDDVLKEILEDERHLESNG